MTPAWKSDCGTVGLFLGDCLPVLQSMADQSIDVLLTDPPYGIQAARKNNPSRSCLAVSRDYGIASWDDSTNEPAIGESRRVCKQQVIFGGNYYHLPPAQCWLVWDKMNGNNDFADCELAWTNLAKAVRKKSYLYGMLRAGNDPRGIHPTQKPEEIMAWALSQTSGETVIDPFMGSGTTGVAAVRFGKSFIGIERDPVFFETAKKRIVDALSQMSFLSPGESADRQLVLFS